jgi:hypothetical protein
MGTGKPGSLRFRSWLRRRYFEATGGVSSPAAGRSALDALEAVAVSWQFSGAKHEKILDR